MRVLNRRNPNAVIMEDEAVLLDFMSYERVLAPATSRKWRAGQTLSGENVKGNAQIVKCCEGQLVGLRRPINIDHVRGVGRFQAEVIVTHHFSETENVIGMKVRKENRVDGFRRHT